MPRLCERPGCSDPGAAAYGMVPEDLLFWIAPLRDAPSLDSSVLCRRHADAMVVPRGWTLDDLREETPRLFKPRPADGDDVARPKRVRGRRAGSALAGDAPEQLQIDGTGEIERPAENDVAAMADAEPADGAAAEPGDESSAERWQPEFDAGDDLDGLLEVKSPLLARAFRGTDRPKR